MRKVRHLATASFENAVRLALLEKAEQEFDVFLTGDRNLNFQQETSRFDLGVVVLHASIQLRHTLPLMPKGSRTLKSG